MRLPFLSPFLLLLAAAPPLGAAPAHEAMDSTDTLTALKASAWTAVEAGRFEDALNAGVSALSMAQHRYGDTHPSIVPFLTDLSTIHRYRAEYDRAESLLKWGLAVRERGLGPGDPLVTESSWQLVGLYDELGRWEEAGFWGRRALGSERRNGDGRLSPRSLSLLGRVELRLGSTREAADLLGKAAKGWGHDGPSDVGEALATLELLARAHRSLGNAEEAEKTLRKGLELARSRAHEGSLELGDAYWNLGAHFHALGDRAGSKGAFEAAQAVFQGHVGVNFDYPNLPSVDRLARTRLALGDPAGAQELLGRSLETLLQVHGPEHPRTAIIRLELARAESALGQKGAALRRSQAALKTFLSFLGPHHPLTIQAQELARDLR